MKQATMLLTDKINRKTKSDKCEAVTLLEET